MLRRTGFLTMGLDLSLSQSSVEEPTCCSHIDQVSVQYPVEGLKKFSYFILSCLMTFLHAFLLHEISFSKRFSEFFSSALLID